MAGKTQAPEDANAFLEHFGALPFDQQQVVLKGCQELMQQAATERLAALDAERATLLALTGRPDASAHQHAGEPEGKTRGPVPIKYFNPATGEHSTGRGTMAKWLKAKQDAGEDIAKYLVSESNPLPDNLK